jgi:hypothetical protein
MNPGQAMAVELLRDNHTYSCMFGHQVVGYENLMSLHPRLIPLEFHEQPGTHDVKAEFWIQPNVLARFRELYPQQQSATVNSILALYLSGAPVIVDGQQAAALRKLGVRNGAEMLANAQAAQAIEIENEELKGKLDFLRSMFKGADVESPV